MEFLATLRPNNLAECLKRIDDSSVTRVTKNLILLEPDEFKLKLIRL